MAMDRNLAAFLKVKETGNLSLTAEQIGLAQPSLTKRLKQLEDEYGVILFERHPRGMLPTAQGAMLYDYAIRIEQLHIQAKEAVTATLNGQLNVVRVGAGPVVRSYFMQPLTEIMHHEFPGTRIEFREDVHTRNLPHLKSGDIDVVFGAISEQHGLEDIETIPMSELTLGVLAHNSHPLFKRRNVSAQDLYETPWVHHSDQGVASKMIEAYYARNGLGVPQSSVKTTSLEFGIQLISQNGFVMPAAVELVEAFKLYGIDALPLSDPIDHFPIGAYVRKSSLAYSAIVRLLEVAKELATGVR